MTQATPAPEGHEWLADACGDACPLGGWQTGAYAAPIEQESAT